MNENIDANITNVDVGSKPGMRALAVMIRILPRFAVYGFSMILVLWYYIAKREGRWSSATYWQKLGLKGGPVTRFFFGLSQATAYSHMILDNLYLGIYGPSRFHLKEEGIEIFKRAVEKNQGLILLSAHVGNWHLAVNFLWNTGTRVHLVIDDNRHEEVRRQMDVAKDKSGHLLIHDASAGPELVFELRKALRQGEVVIVAGDRVRGDRRTRVSFLGSDAWFPTTAYFLAAVTKAPVCMALIFRTGMQCYKCFGVGPFNDEVLDNTTDRDAKIQAMALCFARNLETYVRQYPKQWFNFFDFWRDT